MITLAQKEELRHAALEVLAARVGTALPLPGISRRISDDDMLDFTFEPGELRAALSLLAGLGHVGIERDSLGSTEYFTASASGVLAFERGR